MKLEEIIPKVVLPIIAVAGMASFGCGLRGCNDNKDDLRYIEVNRVERIDNILRGYRTKLEKYEDPNLNKAISKLEEDKNRLKESKNYKKYNSQKQLEDWTYGSLALLGLILGSSATALSIYSILEDSIK